MFLNTVNKYYKITTLIYYLIIFFILRKIKKSELIKDDVKSNVNTHQTKSLTED